MDIENRQNFGLTFYHLRLMRLLLAAGYANRATLLLQPGRQFGKARESFS